MPLGNSSCIFKFICHDNLKAIVKTRPLTVYGENIHDGIRNCGGTDSCEDSA